MPGEDDVVSMPRAICAEFLRLAPAVLLLERQPLASWSRTPSRQVFIRGLISLSLPHNSVRLPAWGTLRDLPSPVVLTLSEKLGTFDWKES